MANMTNAEYISTTLAYGNENRDDPDNNRKWRYADVQRAVNCSRQRILRRVMGGLYRKRETTNATAGAIIPPADFFNEGIVRYRAKSSDQYRLLINEQARDMDMDTPNWREQTGEPSKIVWDLTTTGFEAWLYPQPVTTVTNGLLWDYSTKLDDLEAADDECPLLNMFPEFQQTLIQAGALFQLYMLEGGEADDQIIKWRGIFDEEVKELDQMISRMFVSNRRMVGRSN